MTPGQTAVDAGHGTVAKLLLLSQPPITGSEGASTPSGTATILKEAQNPPEEL